MKLALIVDSKVDVPYLAYLKPMLSGHEVTVITKSPDFILPITTKYEGVICSDEEFLNIVVKKSRRVNLKDYAGSLVVRNGKPFVFINPLAQIHTVPYGRFILQRYFTKITSPELWSKSIPFTWGEVTNEIAFETLYEQARIHAVAIAIDIETRKEPDFHIAICSYSLILTNDAGTIFLNNFTFAIDSPERYEWMKRLNALPAPKIFQNGIYDNSWFLRYGAVVENWSFDTMDLFHSWYSELPKRLDFVTSFCVRESWFWKNDSKIGGQWADYCEYGCRDVWATSCSFLYLIEHMPDWAITNYLNKFPVNFPALLCGVRGWRIDEELRETLKSEKIPEIEAAKKELGDIVGNAAFNPGSPKQVTALFNIISNKPVTSSDEETTKKVGAQHPFNERICRNVLEYREASKIVSTYLNARLIHARFLYSLGPSGTDTGRLNSQGSFLWSGSNVQNIPRGSVVKSCFVSDNGFMLAEPDAEQADARGVAYLSGDMDLISTVESGLSYHGVNASKFFGIPYEEIIGEDGRVLDVEIYDLSKRVNHGVNYNMQENKLLQVMGVSNVIKAQRLLKLPAQWPLKKVTRYLLDQYGKAYPTVQKDYYQYLSDCVRATHRYTGPTGLTRWFFGKPWEGGHEFNAMIAHASQSLTGQIINEGFKRLFQFERRNGGNFKLLAQIHDSIPFQYREGRLDLAVAAADLMRIPVKVKDCHGVERTMVIPIALKAEGRRWSELVKVKLSTTQQPFIIKELENA